MLDGDNLDDGDADAAKRAEEMRKKKASPTKPTKRRKKARLEEEESESELIEVVGKIVQTPKTGQGRLQQFQSRTRLSVLSNSSWTDLSEHVRLSGLVQRLRTQRSGMARFCLGSNYLTPLTIDILGLN